MAQALLLIDIQNDFCPNGALAVAEGDAVAPYANQAMAQYAHVIATQDWHPSGHSSFASAHQAAPFSVTQMPYGDQVLWPDHCIQGQAGAQFHPELNLDPVRMIVRKGMNPKIDSYSAFFENDHETSTGLHGYLQNLGVSDVTLIGLATDYCVAYSAMDAAKLGYHVCVDLKGCRAIDLDGSLSKALGDMRAVGVQIKE